MVQKKNKNRTYQQLRVWQDAVEYYKLNSNIFRKFPYEFRRVASQAISSSDSVHRNIAEGHCRKTLKDYVHFLYIALSSLGESVSGIYAYRASGQISEKDFESLDSLAFKLENGLIKLIEKLQTQQESGTWIESMKIKELNTLYATEKDTKHQ